MFGLGWAEIMVAAVVGLIVIGPKELPVVFRKIGQFVGKAKGMARDFSRAMNDAADDSGIKESMDTMNSMQEGIRNVTDPTTKWKDFAPGSETSKLAKKLTEKSKKKNDIVAAKNQARLDEAESANKAVEPHNDSEQVTKVQLKKSVQKKSAASKVLAKPTIAKKTSVGSKKVVIKKDAANKTPPKLGRKT